MTDGYGVMLNQKAEFFEKIPVDIIIRLNEWEVNNNRQFANMEEVFNKAIEIETSQMNVTMSSHILLFTGQTQSISGYHYLQETHTNPYWQNRRGLR